MPGFPFIPTELQPAAPLGARCAKPLPFCGSFFNAIIRPSNRRPPATAHFRCHSAEFVAHHASSMQNSYWAGQVSRTPSSRPCFQYSARMSIGGNRPSITVGTVFVPRVIARAVIEAPRLRLVIERPPQLHRDHDDDSLYLCLVQI